MLTKTDVQMRYGHLTRVLERRSGVIRGVLMFFYCIGIMLLLDLLYSNLVYTKESRASARIANPVYHHDLAAGFSGYDGWGGGNAYGLYTNSLGFKDASLESCRWSEIGAECFSWETRSPKESECPSIRHLPVCFTEMGWRASTGSNS